MRFYPKSKVECWTSSFQSKRSSKKNIGKRNCQQKRKEQCLCQCRSVNDLWCFEKLNLFYCCPCLESGLQKLRRKALPPIPTDQKFIIPDVYKETYANERFLLYDKRKSSYGGRLLVFASDEQLRVLFQSDVLFADGTFKVAPKLFEQLYVIHALQCGEGTRIFLTLIFSNLFFFSICKRTERKREMNAKQWTRCRERKRRKVCNKTKMAKVIQCGLLCSRVAW